MLQRLDAMESELSALIESLRTGSNRLNADLQLLEGNLTEVTEAVSPRPRFEREAEGTATETETEAEAVEAALPPIDEAEYETEAEAGEFEDDEGAEAIVYVEEIEVEAEVGADGAAGDDDTEGARLIALNMALNGTPREETDRYLAENFQLADRGGLLDEVYSSVEG
jgi:hypothetical protein